MNDWLDDREAFQRSQARSLEIGREWTRAMEGRVQGAFGQVGPEDLEGSAAAAEGLLSDSSWVSDVLRPLAGALGDDPAFVPPLRVHRDALRTLAVLHEGAHGRLSASILSAGALAALPRAGTVVAGGRVSVVRYCQAGGAVLGIWDAPPPAGDLATETIVPCTRVGQFQVTDGLVLRLDGRMRAHLVESARADVVMLTMSLRAGAAAQVREYGRDDGRFVRAAELGETESRARMLLTLLRVSGRADAGDCFEAMTHEPGFALRWAAMREWLATDARGALPRLSDMTRDPNAEVRAAARATLALVEERLAA